MDVASYLLGKKSAGGGGGSDEHIQYDTIPIASAETVGKIIQYVGETTSDYTNGYFYIGTTDGEAVPTYSWENINVQEGMAIDEVQELINDNIFILDENDISKQEVYRELERAIIYNQSKNRGMYILFTSNKSRPYLLYNGLTTDFALTDRNYSFSVNINEIRPIGNKSRPVLRINYSNKIITSMLRSNDNAGYSALDVDNTTAYTPTGDYNPATKKYVDDNAGGGLDENTVRTLINNAGVVEINDDVLAYLYEKYNLGTYTEGGTTAVNMALLWYEYRANFYKTNWIGSGTKEFGNVYIGNNSLIFLSERANMYIALSNNDGNASPSLKYGYSSNTSLQQYKTYNSNSINYLNDSYYGDFFKNFRALFFNNIMYLNTSQSITALHTYTELPQSSVTPTTANQFTNKAYVDGLPTSYAGYDVTKTQVLKNVNGTLTWVDE